MNFIAFSDNQRSSYLWSWAGEGILTLENCNLAISKKILSRLRLVSARRSSLEVEDFRVLRGVFSRVVTMRESEVLAD